MKVIIYSVKTFEREYLLKANKNGHELLFVKEPLCVETAALAKGCEAAMIFIGDDASAKPLEALKQNGVKYIAIRAFEYDNIDIKKATELRMRVANVNAYPPNTIAEHTLALILAFNRKLIAADKQVREFNFSAENLVGVDLANKTVGIIGTGKIGYVVAKILHGFGCKLVAFDPYPDIELTRTCHVNYVSLEQLCGTSDIITLHAPLNEGTRNLINKGVIDEMKTGVMLINTASGRLVNTSDVCDALQTKRLGFFGADVYAYGKGVMFFNQPSAMAEDLLLAQLLKMPNVIITPHTAFATTETLAVIAATSFYNINCWHTNQQSPNELAKTRGNFPSQTH